jgi:hypothetical protein
MVQVLEEEYAPWMHSAHKNHQLHQSSLAISSKKVKNDYSN